MNKAPRNTNYVFILSYARARGRWKLEKQCKRTIKLVFNGTYRFVGHFLPQFSALLSKLADAHARELGLDRLSALVHPDEVGRRKTFRLARQLHILMLPLAFHPTAAASAEKPDRKFPLTSRQNSICT